MKRDMDLVRAILIKTEEADEVLDIMELCAQLDHYSPSLIAYHVDMMAAHGLLDANIQYTKTDVIGGLVHGLTWDGADYLDAIRNPKVWGRVKDVIKQAVGSTTLSVIKETACAVALSLIQKGIDGS